MCGHFQQNTSMMKLVPFDENSLPFTLPVAMPLQMVYTSAGAQKPGKGHRGK
jgi:hypothetical protein